MDTEHTGSKTLIELFYKSLGRTVPSRVERPGNGFLAFISTVYVVGSTLMLLFLNFFSLMVGVRISCLGRDGTKFTFLHLFRRIPIIGIALPLLFGYAIWHNVQLSGPGRIVVTPFLTAALAIVAITVVMAVNSFTARRKP